MNTHQTAHCAPLISSQEIPQPSPDYREGGSADCRKRATPDGRGEISDAYMDMQRALMRWDIFGTFDCAAEYTLAHARWLNLQAEGRVA